MPEMARNIGDLPWVKDGVEKGEFNALSGLIRLADAGHTARLIEEPWVVEGRNYPALESLWYLETSNPEAVSRIMSHPTISDGISDQEAKIIATLHGVDSDQLEKLLDPEQVTLEERTITLPMAGETDLTIIRTRPGTDHAMDSLEQAVRSIEEFMGFPFPRRQVIFLFDDALRIRGQYQSTHVSIRADEEVKTQKSMLTLLAHETGHYYWNNSSRWVNEGAAHITASVADNALQGPLISLSCPLGQSIAEVQNWGCVSSTSNRVHPCHYSLGERIFRDLYHNLDDTTFRLAFRRLYLDTVFDVSDECDDDSTNICHVRESFTISAPDEKTPTIERIISRWYDAPEPRDISWIEETPVNPNIAAIDGRIEEAYISQKLSMTPISEVIVGPNRNPVVNLNLEYSYRHTGDLQFLPVYVYMYLDDGSGSGIQLKATDLDVLPLPLDAMEHRQIIDVGFWRELGRFWIQAYSGEQKIAEATFEAVPEPDPHNIRGLVTYTGGQPPKGIALQLRQGQERFWVKTGPDGTFNVEVPSGTFIAEVIALFGSHWHFAGWYDGAGITTDSTQALEIIVDDRDVEGIEIMLSADTYPHRIRGTVTDAEGRPLERIGLSVIQGDEWLFEDKTGADGAFDIVVSSGAFTLRVLVPVDDSTWHTVGWYDGSGGITTDRSKVFEVVVEDTDVEGIEIILSAEDIPDLDPPNIRGVVTGLGGQPLDNVGLSAKEGEEAVWVKTGPDGTFNVVVSSGTFILQVYVLDGSIRNAVGWYDGSGGITTDRSQAFEVVVDDADIEGIEIKLPTQP